MKKLLIIVIIILLVTLAGFTITKGLNIGSLSIAGIQKIRESNEELDSKLQEATKIASTDYQSKLKILNDNVNELEKQKKGYEELVNVSTDSQVSAANESKTYPIEYLLIKIENHADEEDVTLKIDIEKEASNAKDVYNINFTATGKYVGIASFIEDVEDDSSLGFKIEEFKMLPTATENVVEATFSCKDITITGITTTTSGTATNNITTNSKQENQTNNTTK